MTFSRRLDAQLARLGRDAYVYEHRQTGTDRMNNPIDEWVKRDDNPVTAVKTYPDPNQEVKGSAGDLHEDQPVFVIPKPSTEDDPAVPDDEDRLEYDGVMYALQAKTAYETHVEFRGEMVTN